MHCHFVRRDTAVVFCVCINVINACHVLVGSAWMEEIPFSLFRPSIAYSCHIDLCWKLLAASSCDVWSVMPSVCAADSISTEIPV